jgi:hypothetical protein
MLTGAQGERRAFEEEERTRQHIRDYAKAKARREVVRKHITELIDSAAQERFERRLADCEKAAHEIACEAGEEASGRASRTEHSVAAYEVAYIEAYADALPALVATTQARCDILDPAGGAWKAAS